MNKNIAKLYLLLIGALFVTFAPMDVFVSFFAIVLAVSLILSIALAVSYILSN